MDNETQSILIPPMPPMNPCPWCGTTEGYFQSTGVTPDHVVKYRYFHVVSVCPVYIYTNWHRRKLDCVKDWNDRIAND